MSTRHSRSIIAIVLMQLLCLQVMASECPVVNPPDKLFDDDKACLAILDKKFASYSPDINFRKDRNAMLTLHFDADQQFVIDTFFARYCELLGEPKWKLSDAERREKLDLAKEKLYARVPFPPPVTNTANLSLLHSPPKTYLVGGRDDHGTGVMFASLMAGLEETIETNESDPSGEHNDTAQVAVVSEYINELPFVVTRGNKHFVMVGSANSRDGAISEVMRLKARAPQFEFVAYPPYKGNSKFAIMMATWASWSVANKALADAKEYVNPGSYIWSCRAEGDNC